MNEALIQEQMAQAAVQGVLTAVSPMVIPSTLKHAHFHAAADQDIPLFQPLCAMAQLIAFRDDTHVAA